VGCGGIHRADNWTFNTEELFMTKEEALEWIHDSKPPRFSGPLFCQVWLDDNSVRLLRRVGDESRSITPGEFVYADNCHPLAQSLCDLGRVVAWRPAAKHHRTRSTAVMDGADG
jgi:hypothetical protein